MFFAGAFISLVFVRATPIECTKKKLGKIDVKSSESIERIVSKIPLLSDEEFDAARALVATLVARLRLGQSLPRVPADYRLL